MLGDEAKEMEETENDIKSMNKRLAIVLLEVREHASAIAVLKAQVAKQQEKDELKWFLILLTSIFGGSICLLLYLLFGLGHTFCKQEYTTIKQKFLYFPTTA